MPRRTTIDDRQTFAVEHGHLVRTVRTQVGSTYQHRCSLGAFKAVVHYLDEHAEAGATTGELWDVLPDVPRTQVSVALAFLKERGCADVRRKRCYPASNFLVEDALLELHALA